MFPKFHTEWKSSRCKKVKKKKKKIIFSPCFLGLQEYLCSLHVLSGSRWQTSGEDTRPQKCNQALQ